MNWPWKKAQQMTDCEERANLQQWAAARMQQQMQMQQRVAQQMQVPKMPPPLQVPKMPPPQRIEELREAELHKARQSARDLQIKLQNLQRAVSSIVLRLKVLDVEALERDLGEDGTVPLRMALSELKALVAAYDGMPKTNIPDYGLLTTMPYLGTQSPSASPSVTPSYATALGGLAYSSNTKRLY